MELASNLVWVLISAAVLAGIGRAVRARALRVPGRSAFLLALQISLLLLPLISLSDDRMEARQHALPASAQTWHLAAQDASTLQEIAPEAFAFLMLVACVFLQAGVKPTRVAFRDAFSVWFTRAQSLRPPPAFAR